MGTSHKKNAKKGFTGDEQELLSGFSVKIARKHKCSGMYVRYIIRGQRGTKTEKAQKIVKDLNTLLAFFRPEE